MDFFNIVDFSWFLETANVLSPYVMVHLICNTIFTAGAVLQIDLVNNNNHFVVKRRTIDLFCNMNLQQSKHMNFNMFATLLGIITSLCNLFVYCFFGKLATESFESMADCLYETNWPEQPIELQKNLILLIANMQKSLHYRGFEVANMELETFTKVITSNQQP